MCSFRPLSLVELEKALDAGFGAFLNLEATVIQTSCNQEGSPLTAFSQGVQEDLRSWARDMRQIVGRFEDILVLNPGSIHQ